MIVMTIVALSLPNLQHATTKGSLESASPQCPHIQSSFSGRGSSGSGSPIAWANSRQL